MRAYFLVILLTIGFVTSLQASIPRPVNSFATLPQQHIDTQAETIQQAFEQKATFFLKGRHFQCWQANQSREVLLKEFDQINDWRFHSWYVDPNAKTLISRADFMVAQDLLEKGYFREPDLIAFQYNRTDPSYNSSMIVINGFRFLALEAPTRQTLRNFFILLRNYRVAQLVRLTSAEQAGREKSFPYWNGKTTKNPKTKETYLNVPQQNNTDAYKIQYYSTDNWMDDKGIDPKLLLQIIQAVRKDYDSQNLLACHCTGGVGRTGTFLAGFLLLTEIDRQMASGTTKKALNISIEKIVMQLSLQRPYMVATSEQYITLYRLVDLYLQGKK